MIERAADDRCWRLVAADEAYATTPGFAPAAAAVGRTTSWCSPATTC